MAGFLEVIWGSGEAEYFFERDWTGQISLKLLRKIARSCATDSPDHPSIGRYQRCSGGARLELDKN
jgi:hypothetical protein